MLNAIRSLFRRKPKPEIDPIPALLHEIAECAEKREKRFRDRYSALVWRFKALSPERQAALLAENGITMADFDRVTGYRIGGV